VGEKEEKKEVKKVLPDDVQKDLIKQRYDPLLINYSNIIT